ncbi:peptidase S1 [uncultured Maricaulis sp.]|uniref:peptidase S1 n=1 Tax=uncultured Maricaulis sp. TaxID=174710 RepID=UPI0030DB52BD|tara:strand:- start:14886 stop:15350 length:465 start_codon:yes stop_codon:yes gene_type:complete
MIRLSILAITLIAGCGAAQAQDTSALPSGGEASLSAGFTPDPFTARLQSGGPIDVSQTRGLDCKGFIASAPDFDLYYNAGALPLIVSVGALVDATLVVHAPDGSWHCDDDSGGGLNPSIRFVDPQSGVYDIWIGTYADAAREEATLSISELSSE